MRSSAPRQILTDRRRPFPRAAPLVISRRSTLAADQIRVQRVHERIRLGVVSDQHLVHDLLVPPRH